MQINRRVALLALSAILSACSAERVMPPRPAPTPAPAPAPTSAPPPPAPSAQAPAGDWRDAPLTPGAWRYGVEGTATVAAFVAPDGSRLFAITCHRERGSLLLSRAGLAGTAVPMSVTTSYGTRPFSIGPLSPTDPTLDLSLPVRDPVLDEMAFSRGRIAVDVNGLPTLYLPAWAEIGRVVEDCRR